MTASGLRQLARASALLTAASTILGCASVTPAAAPAAAPLHAPAPPQPAPASEPAPRQEGVPDVNLTGALLYQLMSAELAVQRGEVGVAFATYLSVARQTRDARVARRATEIAINARATAQALEAARLWRELAPNSDEAEQAQAALLIAANRYDEAAPLFAHQLKRSPTLIDDLTRVQRLLARAPDRAAGFALLTKLAQPYRDDPTLGADVRLTLAAGAHAVGNLKLATEEARAALALRPDFERAALVAAQFLARPDGRDDPEGRNEAIRLLADFVQRNPKSLNARLTYARLLVGAGRIDEAQRQFAQVVAQDENNLDALFAVGVLGVERPALRAEAKRALERYVQLVEAAPGDGGGQRSPDPAYLNLARIAEDERRYADALAWLDRVDEGEQFFAAQLRKALVLGKMKRVEEGRRLLADTRADSDAERVQVLLTEGQLLRDAGRHKEALGLLEGALKKMPDDTALLYDAALVAEKLDLTDLMETYLRRVIKLKPDEAHAYNALGYSLADRNQRLPEAYELIRKALKLAPEDGFILDSMGWVYFRMGELSKARDYLQRAWNLRPHAEVGAHLGEVLWVQGDRDGARRIWKESRTMEPDNETLLNTLKRFKVRL